MKRTKKMLALVLAMVMAFSLLAVTAAAYGAEEHEHECAACSEDEGVMPRGAVRPCTRENCDGTMELVNRRDNSGNIYKAFVCDRCGAEDRV